jgi:hypothetical protein
MDMLYFPDEVRRMVADRIRPLIARDGTNFTQPNFGNLILFPSISMVGLLFLE